MAPRIIILALATFAALMFFALAIERAYHYEGAVTCTHESMGQCAPTVVVP